jgi:uncharacterized membrane-anchored protein
MKALWTMALACVLAGAATAEATAPTAAEVRKNLTGVSGKVDLPGGLAQLDLAEGFTYLDPQQTQFLLEKVWHNPDGSGFLGAVLPPNFLKDDSAGWAALIAYDSTGHVKDDDAASMNYDDLLKQLRDGAAEANKTRKEKGFDEVQIIGWATKPHYDSQGKTLYWAKELNFSGSTGHTLNYEMRVLGRQGVLDVNVVASLDDLPTVEKATPTLLGQMAFKPGQKYADFQEGSDHLAEYGVAGLILGGVALKAGLFKVILTALAASWKFILLGLAAVGAFFSRIFKKKKQEPLPSSSPSSSPSPSPGPDAGSGPQDPPASPPVSS